MTELVPQPTPRGSRFTPPPQSQRSAPVMVIYWVMVLGGLAMFTATRPDEPSTLAPLWIGAIGGTILGQYLALHNLRLWLAGAIIALVGLYCGPLLPSGHASAQLWQAFLPAALCAFWSLGDRAVLAAAWFPAVLWMLAILDRNDQPLAPDGVAAILLGVLALLFVGFLRVRESRRVELWRTVSPEPLAPIQPAELLREPPARQLARVGWGLTVSAITVALTVWLAPPLWQTETLSGEDVAVAVGPTDGLPCCPLHQDVHTDSTRVREYLDIGLGHDEHSDAPREGVDCRVCGEPVVAAIVTDDDATIPRVPAAFEDVPVGPRSTSGTSGPVYGGAPSRPGNTTRSAPDRSFHPAMPSNPLPLAAADPAPVEPAALPPPEPLPPPPPRPRRHAAPPPPPPAPVATPSTPPQPGVVSRTSNPHRVAADSAGRSLLRWLALAIVAALVLQLVRLALRPLRRLITLRHLRRPFWDETIDQRVSNAWQLALIGLRDAGWRAGLTEAPHELARRVKVDGLDRCAAVLERARHGVGLDTGDLTEMQSAADVAYRAARTGVGGVARAIGWLRWPLT